MSTHLLFIVRYLELTFASFQYNPIPRPKRKAPSSFPLQLPLRKGPHDDDEELASAKFEVAKLDGQFAEAAKSVDKLSKARKSEFTSSSTRRFLHRADDLASVLCRSRCFGGRLWKQARHFRYYGTGSTSRGCDAEARTSSRRDCWDATRTGEPLSLSFSEVEHVLIILSVSLSVCERERSHWGYPRIPEPERSSSEGTSLSLFSLLYFEAHRSLIASSRKPFFNEPSSSRSTSPLPKSPSPSVGSPRG